MSQLTWQKAGLHAALVKKTSFLLSWRSLCVNQSLCHSDKGTEQSNSNSGISVLTHGPEVSVCRGVKGIERPVRSLHGVEEGKPPRERVKENTCMSGLMCISFHLYSGNSAPSMARCCPRPRNALFDALRDVLLAS